MLIKLDKLIITKYTLLLYSILPALSKMSGMSFFYAFYIPLYGILYWIYRQKYLKLYRNDTVFLLMFSFAIAYIPISIFILKTTSLISVFFGTIMFVLPMTGYFFSRLININIFIQSVIFVGLVHAILGILMYGFIQFPVSIQLLIELIKEGTMAFRMSSVSGSLGLGSLMLISFPFALIKLMKSKNKKNMVIAIILIFALIMTMQRSVWLAVASYFLLAFIYIKLNNKSFILKRNIYLFIFILFCSGVFILQFINLNTLDFILSRITSMLISEDTNLINERSSTWLEGIDNFIKIPSGIGLGTTGQAARVSEFISSYYSVLDGDYFRILSELGIGALFFYFYLFTFIIVWFFNLRYMGVERFSIYLVVIGLSLNMVGSNTTEFHFVNFLYWMSIGYLFNKNLTKDNNDFIYNSKF